MASSIGYHTARTKQNDALFGRLTTLQKLDKVRNDPHKHKYRRMQADRAIKRIVAQLHDRALMRLRERLIRATVAGDLTAVWKIENQIRAYEGQYEGIEEHE